MTEQEFADRIEELMALRPGWLDGDGKAPVPGIVALIAYTVTEQFQAHLPRLYPMENGGVQMEWGLEGAKAAGWYDSLEVEWENGLFMGRFHGWNADTGNEESFSDVLDGETWWRVLKTLNEHYPS